MKRTLPGAAAAVPALPLGPSADQMPQIGFGTWGLQPQEVSTAIRAAVAAGYRSFDCAPVYQNERQVGETLSALIAEGVVTRSELFITSKVPPADACSRHRTERALRQSLHDLRTGYVDLYLIHWPFCVRSPEPGRPRPWPLPLEDQLGYSAEQLREEWRTIEALVATRAVRHAGLANIGERRLAKFLASPDLAVRPAVVQAASKREGPQFRHRRRHRHHRRRRRRRRLRPHPSHPPSPSPSPRPCRWSCTRTTR